jgi:hypothetical protein
LVRIGVVVERRAPDRLEGALHLAARQIKFRGYL